MIGSKSLKAKGLQKEQYVSFPSLSPFPLLFLLSPFSDPPISHSRLPLSREAQAYKVQGAELAEAERHEREALMRRERAVAHGAHPDHRHLGGMPGSATGGAGSGETAPGGLGGASSGGGY